MKLSKRQVVTAGAAALAAVGVMGGTLAFFTDYDSRDLTAKAGVIRQIKHCLFRHIKIGLL